MCSQHWRECRTIHEAYVKYMQRQLRASFRCVALNKQDLRMLMSQHQRPCIGVEAQRKLLCWHLLFIWWTKTGRCIVYEVNNDHALDRLYLIKSQPFLLVRRMRENRHQRIYVGLCPNKHPPTLWKCLPDFRFVQFNPEIDVIGPIFDEMRMGIVPWIIGRAKWLALYKQCCRMAKHQWCVQVCYELFLIFNRVIG